MHEAMFYERFNDRLICKLCPNRCIIKNQEKGICGTRLHMDGKLYALNFGRVSAIQIDPIEKKPIANWHPGTQVLSIGSFGCNLHCPFCQNHELVHGAEHGVIMTPEAVVAQAIAMDLEAIAYTYNEPTVFYEMVYETAVEAKKRGLYNVMVTNGYIEKEPLEKLLPYMDAFNIDVKSYDEKIFREMCGGRLQSVIDVVKMAKKRAHVEITLLMVPELYADMEETERFCQRLSLEVGDVPVHLSRYFPRYKHITAPTSVEKMVALQKRLLHYFSFVYLGNVY